ncbi:MAG: fused MFS/spermidine synthase [Acidobacteriota bacterium]
MERWRSAAHSHCSCPRPTGGESRGGESAGGLYAASAIGSIAGSLLTAFVMVPWLGLDGASVLCTILAGGSALICTSRAAMLAAVVVVVSAANPFLYRHPAGLFVTGTYAYAYRYAGGEAAAPAAPPPRRVLALYASLDDPSRPRLPAVEPPEGNNAWIFRKDGLCASVAVGESAGVRSLLINGKTDASSFGPGDMRTQLLLGHLPSLLRRADGGRALVIGLGSGTTLTAIAEHPFREVVAAEVEPAVVQAAVLFAATGGGVPARATVVVDDGRQVLARDPGTFDVITSEPSNLWMAGVAHLFTRELFQEARAHLAPGGLFCQWLHLYQIGEDDVRVLLRTLRAVFPRLHLFADGPDLLVIAGDTLADPEVVSRRFQVAGVRAHLARGRFDELPRILETYVGDETLVDRFAGAGPLNTDDAPILEFRAPKSLLRDDSARILASLCRAAGP